MMEKYNTTTTATSTMHPFTLASHDDVNQHVTSLDGEPAFPITPVLSLELENISKMSKGGREGLSYMWSGGLLNTCVYCRHYHCHDKLII